MIHFRDIPLGRKLMVAFLAAGIIPLVIAALLSLANEVASQRERGERDLTATAELIAVSTRATLDFDDAVRARETLATLIESPSILAASLYKPDGRIFATYVRPSEKDFRFPAMQPSGTRSQQNRLELFRPIGTGRDVAGSLYVAMDLGFLRAQLPRYMLIVAGVLAGLAALSFWISRLFQRVISGPILALAETAQIVQDTGNYSVRAPRQGHDEIGRVIDAFNQMLSATEERAAALRVTHEALLVEVAERQRAQSEIQLRSLELEAAVHEQEAFSYSVSHDLRAPLRAIDGFSRLLATQFRESMPAEAVTFLDRVRSNTQHMGTLIDELLNLSKLSRQPLRTATVNHDALIEHCLELLHDDLQTRNVQIVKGTLPPCQGDPSLLELVWMNLLSNALKYTRRRDPAVIEIGCAANGKAAYFVRDNGVGFSMAYADKLFGVFQRLHRAEDYEGTGVGLANVQRIVHRHGGRVWAEAALDQGASFYFTLKSETTS